MARGLLAVTRSVFCWRRSANPRSRALVTNNVTRYRQHAPDPRTARSYWSKAMLLWLSVVIVAIWWEHSHGVVCNVRWADVRDIHRRAMRLVTTGLCSFFHEPFNFQLWPIVQGPDPLSCCHLSEFQLSTNLFCWLLKVDTKLTKTNELQYWREHTLPRHIDPSIRCMMQTAKTKPFTQAGNDTGTGTSTRTSGQWSLVRCSLDFGVLPRYPTCPRSTAPLSAIISPLDFSTVFLCPPPRHSLFHLSPYLHVSQKSQSHSSQQTAICKFTT